MNSFETVLVAALVVAVAAVAFLAFKLHRAGVPNAQIAGKVLAQVEAEAIAWHDKIVAVIAEESAKAAAKVTLQDAYYDEANFQQALGRLPPTFTQAVILKRANGEEKPERDGTFPARTYVEQANGSIKLTT